MLRISADQAMRQALAAGATFFQYRSKKASRRSIYGISAVLARIAADAGALFIVNDHADIAAAVNADGVHLGQDDLPIEHARKVLGGDKLIGISTHNREQAVAAEAAGADYIGFGPIFPSTTKDAGRIQGIRSLSVIKQAVTLPLIAIGGIDFVNVQDVIGSGADGVAVISAVVSSDDITAAAERMLRSISDARRV